MGEPIVRRGKGLIKIADLIAAEAIEELIDVNLPLINRLIVTDQLG